MVDVTRLLLFVFVSQFPRTQQLLEDSSRISDLLSIRNESRANLINLCDAILKASFFKEIYIITADKERALETELLLLQDKFHHTVMVKTFSSLLAKTEELQPLCSRGMDRNEMKSTTKETEPQKLFTSFPYTLVLVFHPSESELIDLFYDDSAPSSTIFILLLRQVSQTFKRIIRKAWKIKYIFRVVMIGSSVHSFVATLYDPFSECELGGRGAFRKIAISNYHEITSSLIANIKSLNGCDLRISMYAREQTVVPLVNHTLTGQDGRLIDLLVEQMNFRPVINLRKDRMVYGYRVVNDTYEGTFASLMHGTADLSLNGHFMKDYKCDTVELTRQITSDRVCLLTPKAGFMPPLITVLKSFQLEVWAMIIVTYVIVVVSYYLWTVFEVQNNAIYAGPPTVCVLALDIFRVFTASPLSRKLFRTSEKVLFAFCWFYSVVILNSFQGSLVTFLNTPMHFPDIDTFEDLIESDLPLRSHSSTFIELLLSDPTLSKLEKRLHSTRNSNATNDFEGRFAGFQRINVFNLKYFKDIKYVPNKHESRLLHTMNQCIMSYFISYAIRKNSPYKRRIDEIISRIDHAGLLIKWNSDASKYIFQKYHFVTTKGRGNVKVFSTRDLEVAFFALLLGLGCSTCVFVVELGLRRKAQLQLKLEGTTKARERHMERIVFWSAIDRLGPSRTRTKIMTPSFKN